MNSHAMNPSIFIPILQNLMSDWWMMINELGKSMDFIQKENAIFPTP